MAIVSVTVTSSVESIVQHNVLPGNAQDRSSVPRGTALYGGTTPIATLAAGNQTRVSITFDFPTVRQYLLKQVSFMYQADTAEETSFGDICSGTYSLDRLSTVASFELFSHGVGNSTSTLKSRRIWQPTPNFPRMFLNGATGDTMGFNLQDLDAGAGGKVAGDMFWTAEFWVFDEEQVRDYPINSPSPVICY